MNEDGCMRRITFMKSEKAKKRTDVDNVAFLELPLVRDAMTDDLVDRTEQ
jgi:hypothetical protein